MKISYKDHVPQVTPPKKHTLQKVTHDGDLTTTSTQHHPTLQTPETHKHDQQVGASQVSLKYFLYIFWGIRFNFMKNVWMHNPKQKLWIVFNAFGTLWILELDGGPCYGAECRTFRLILR